MKTIYEDIVKKAKEGRRVYIDLKEKEIKVGNTFIIKEGKPVNAKASLINKTENPWQRLEELYQNFKYSLPNKELGSKPYFKALSYEELPRERMLGAENRNAARVELEAFILLSALAGFLKWEKDGWFYQSQEDKDFIILKEYL